MQRRSNQMGFTLIEIISVLIILGILAAVAVPQYINLTADAEKKAIASVKSELQARSNAYWAKFLLDESAANSAKNSRDAATFATDEGLTIGNDYVLGDNAGAITVQPTGSSNTYEIAFTAGISVTDDTGKPAILGDITGP